MLSVSGCLVTDIGIVDVPAEPSAVQQFQAILRSAGISIHPTRGHDSGAEHARETDVLAPIPACRSIDRIAGVLETRASARMWSVLSSSLTKSFRR